MKQDNKRRPNLIYVFADQLRYSSCGFAGDDKALTPNIDRFANTAVNFCNAVSGSPVCCPYRNSLFTGKYASSTGMVINELRCLPDPEALGHILTNHGYETAYIGKWHLYGRSHKEQFVPPGPYRLGFDGYWAGNNFHHADYYRGFYYHDTEERKFAEGYEPDFQTELAIDYLRKADRSKPFAMVLSYGTPHDPWEWDNAPQQFREHFQQVRFPVPPNYKDGSADRYWMPKMTEEWFIDNWKPYREQFLQVYYAMVANLDQNFGKLLSALQEAGLEEETIIVFTSDHGEMFGAQGRIAKKIFYEESVHVPFLLSWKGTTPEGAQSDACLNTVDIMPTLLDFMDLPIPSSVQGVSLKTQALGQSGPEPEAAFLQGMGHTYLWMDGDEWRAVRDKRYTYAVMRCDGAEYLFDRQSDPYQLRNLAEHPNAAQQLATYRSMMQRKMEQLNDRFEACTWYEQHWVQDRAIVRSATRHA